MRLVRDPQNEAFVLLSVLFASSTPFLPYVAHQFLPHLRIAAPDLSTIPRRFRTVSERAPGSDLAAIF